jgi:uncharacterized RDD family membrane protein YckC
MATNVRDPRSIITPDAFGVSPALLGTPLAAPSRRAFALLIDLIVVGTLTAITSNVALLVWGVVAIFFVGMAFRRPDMGQITGVLFRGATGCLGMVILMGVGIGYLATRTDVNMGLIDSALSDLGEGTPPGAPDSPGAGNLFRGLTGAASLRQAADTTEARQALEQLLGALAATGTDAGEIEAAAKELGQIVPADAPWRADLDVVVARAVASRSVPEPAEVADPAAAPTVSAEPAAGLTPEALAVVADTLRALSDSLTGARTREAALARRLDRAQEELEAREGGFFALLADIWDQLGSAIGLWSVYFTVALTLTGGRTVGKKAMGLRVLRLDGGPITWWFAFERAGGYVAGIATGLLGFAQIWWDPNRQCVHDKIGGTVVVIDGAEPIPGAWQEAWRQQQVEEAAGR